jgi:hypothetical protein
MSTHSGIAWLVFHHTGGKDQTCQPHTGEHFVLQPGPETGHRVEAE